MDYDPKDTVRQQFVDAIIGACNAKWATDGYAGFGWHLVELTNSDPVVVIFKTGIPLRGYKEGVELFGPHQVRVTIEALPLGVVECMLCKHSWGMHDASRCGEVGCGCTNSKLFDISVVKSEGV